MLTNPVFLWGYAHVLLAVARHRGRRDARRLGLAPAARLGRRPVRAVGPAALVVLLPAVLLGMIVGSHSASIEDKYQPMKIAASEAQWETCQPCSFSVFQIGGGNRDETPTKIIADPAPAVAARDGLLERPGAGAQRAQRAVPAAVRARRLRAERVHPVLVDARDGLPRPRWCSSSRSGGCWLIWRRHARRGRGWFLRLAVWVAALPFLINTAGWMLTENGRQPWIVQGLMQTSRRGLAVGQHGWVVTSILTFFLLYAVLAVVAWCLMIRYARRGPEPAEPRGADDARRAASPP